MSPSVGDRWSRRLTVTRDHLHGFAAISGDDNPIHVDAGYAARTDFGRPVAHGMFLFSLVRAGLTDLVPDGRLVAQRLMFPAPTPEGADVEVLLEVVAVAPQVEVAATVRTIATDARGLTGTCTLHCEVVP